MQITIFSDVHGNLTALQAVLANISSVSKPMDGDTHAKNGLLTWNTTKRWQVEIKRVTNDIQQEQAILAKSKPPKWERMGRVLDGELFLG